MIFENWLLVECDLQDCGVDIADREMMRRRSWRWLRTRIIGLVSGETRFNRKLTADTEKPESTERPTGEYD